MLLPHADIRCLTFDLDDTLWDCAPVIERAEQALFDWLAAEYPRIARAHDLNALRTHRMGIARSHPHLRHDVSLLRILALRDLARRHGYAEDLAEPGLALFRSHRNRVTLYEGVRELLMRLRSRYRLGCISNGNADLEAIGIADLFDFSVFAAEVGACKPQAEVYAAAVGRAGVSAAEMLHVGDDAEADVLGASRAGLYSAWLNAALKPWPGGRLPDAMVRSVHEVEALLQMQI